MLALTLALSFLSIAGIPPLAGFLSKWLLLLVGISGGLYLNSAKLSDYCWGVLCETGADNIFSLRVKRIFDVSMTVKKELI